MLAELKNYLKSLERVVIAFSGGVDSAFLLSIAHEVLKENAIAVNISSAFTPQSEAEDAKKFCEKRGIPLTQIKLDVLSLDEVKKNPPDRCYYCKKNIFTSIKNYAHSINAKYVLDGTNFDDTKDYRPGVKALKELEILSPLKQFQFTKKDIYAYSKELQLEFWNKPSQACLASRVAYYEELNEEKLSKIERAEEYLHNLGATQLRVRLHGNLARLEILEQELALLLNRKNEIVAHLKTLGFDYITLDLKGFRSGSMNEVLSGK